MTIYCDSESCLYNEGGFCNAEKLTIIGMECTLATGFDNKEAKDETN